MASVLKAAALRAKYLTASNYTLTSTSKKRTAVVVGATSGIGEACAHRLAEQGYTVIAVGRNKPGRGDEIVSTLESKSKTVPSGSEHESNTATLPKHEFRSLDAFSLKDVKIVAEEIAKDHEVIDALIMTQGMATTQGFTPTEEGNDEKLTLHYWSRITMTLFLLPSLRRSTMAGGSVVLSVLSGGVHGPYQNYKVDPELRMNYGIKNAADFAGFYTDLGLDYMALRDSNSGVNFVHASPGFVNTNWGQEFGVLIKCFVRMMQPLGRKASDCAEFMLGPTVFASDYSDALPTKSGNRGEEGGVWIIGGDGESKDLTTLHTIEASKFVWETTVEVLKKSGVTLDK